VKTSARINEVLAAGMTIVVVVFFGFVIRFLLGLHEYGAGFFSRPFYDPATFNLNSIFTVLPSRFDIHRLRWHLDILGGSRNPRRNILLATVLVCVVTGVLSSLEVYAAQLVWGSKAFSHRTGGIGISPGS